MNADEHFDSAVTAAVSTTTVAAAVSATTAATATTNIDSLLIILICSKNLSETILLRCVYIVFLKVLQQI